MFSLKDWLANNIRKAKNQISNSLIIHWKWKFALNFVSWRKAPSWKLVLSRILFFSEQSRPQCTPVQWPRAHGFSATHLLQRLMVDHGGHIMADHAAQVRRWAVWCWGFNVTGYGLVKPSPILKPDLCSAPISFLKQSSDSCFERLWTPWIQKWINEEPGRFQSL